MDSVWTIFWTVLWPWGVLAGLFAYAWRCSDCEMQVRQSWVETHDKLKASLETIEDLKSENSRLEDLVVSERKLTQSRHNDLLAEIQKLDEQREQEVAAARATPLEKILNLKAGR
jgi:hypothetical protein